jgi:RimJ/RimL family protein N-acetyltransferase
MLIDHWPLLGLRLITPLAVFADGQIVGQQEISARDFPVLREVSTFSWLGVRYHGSGIGTQMRAAVLHLAFAGLGATDAVSGAFDDNTPSLRVSDKLGYQSDGIERLAAHGQVTTTRRLRLTRERWEAADRVPVTITGLAPCLPLFGLPGG